LVESSANRAYRPIADDGQLSVDVHAGHEAGQISIKGRAVFVDALIGEAEAGYGLILK
jgi:hypothetical protein